MNRDLFLKEIKNNINKYGFHITYVNMDIVPFFSYTIGLLDKIQFELLFIGGFYYSLEERSIIFNHIVKELLENKNLRNFKNDLGSFTLINVDNSWSEKLLLGVYDYYNIISFKALQIIPDKINHTLEIPNTNISWNLNNHIWKYLDENIKWEYNLPINSVAIVNINALQGKRLIICSRWEEDTWEIFSDLEVTQEQARVIPLATILGIDSSLIEIIDLKIDQSKFRTSKNLNDYTWNDYDD